VSACAVHGDSYVLDPWMHSYRCTACGHRFLTAAGPLRSTRSMAPWWWLAELYGRRAARKGGKR
jgi:hypothetical protein